MQQYPRVLIISNECISNITSNGRTLRNFLVGWPKENLAQFHIRRSAPDYSVCDNYFFVSDKAALRSFISGERVNGIQSKREDHNSVYANKISKGSKRNAVTMLIREMVWNSMRWAGTEFDGWIERFSPEVVLLQAGDCGFMLRLARRISEKYRIPLVIYNSEAYYLKKRDYFASSKISKLFFPIFHRNFCKEFENTIKHAEKSIYCCDKLKEDYDAYFSLPSEVIYTATEVKPSGEKDDTDSLKISYLGNLGIGRHEGLVEIAEILQRISPHLKLNVYGKIPNQQVQDAFVQCSGIHYCGFVSYEEVLNVIQNSDILVHTESFSDFSKEDLKYAFSTKIADSLASGKCFLVYAPGDMACSEYLRKNQAAYVAGNAEELEAILQTLWKEPKARNVYIDNALQLVQQRHDAEKNARQFEKVLFESIKE